MQPAGGTIVLFGGPAGAGKSTLARAWCKTRLLATHIELDEVRNLIVSGRADPQETSASQARQYGIAVQATCSLARTFSGAGYDVAVDDVLEPAAFDQYWRRELDGLAWTLVAVVPSLAETLARSAARKKRVREEHTRAQHKRCLEWDDAVRIDTSGLDVARSLALVLERLGSPH